MRDFIDKGNRDPYFRGYEKLFRAALYMRAHFNEWMKDEVDRTAYYSTIDALAKEFPCIDHEKPPEAVSAEERELEEAALDFETAVQGKKVIEKYKADAVYIADLIRKSKK